jgi:transposase
MVVDDGKSVYRASRDLKIHNSTAKAIIRNYRRKGRIYKRKSENPQEGRFEDEAPQPRIDEFPRPQ